MTEPAPHVAVVIVSYNTRALLDDCLRALLASTGVTLDVWVVDNASKDGSADHVAAAFPGVHLVRNPDNRGFAATVASICEQAEKRLIELNKRRRETIPASELNVGVQCGGSAKDVGVNRGGIRFASRAGSRRLS